MADQRQGGASPAPAGDVRDVDRDGADQGAGPDWDAVRAGWVAGRSVAWLSRTFGVPKSTLHRRMTRELGPKGSGRGPTVPYNVTDRVGGLPSGLDSGTADSGEGEGRGQGGGVGEGNARPLESPAERVEARLLQDHQRRTKALQRALDRLTKAGPESWGGRSPAAGLAALAQAHERLVRVDRLTAGLDNGRSVQVGVIVVGGKAASPAEWAEQARATATAQDAARQVDASGRVRSLGSGPFGSPGDAEGSSVAVRDDGAAGGAPFTRPKPGEASARAAAIRSGEGAGGGGGGEEEGDPG